VDVKRHEIHEESGTARSHHEACGVSQKNKASIRSSTVSMVKTTNYHRSLRNDPPWETDLPSETSPTAVC
jgi:hypothetical protein